MARWVIAIAVLAAVLGGCRDTKFVQLEPDNELPAAADVQNAATLRLARAPSAQTSSIEGTVVISGLTVLDTNGLPVAPTQAASKVMARLVDPEDDILATVYPNGFGRYRIDYKGTLPSGKLRFTVRVQQDLNGDSVGGDTLQQVVPVKLALGRVCRVDVNFTLGTQADLGQLQAPAVGAAVITRLTTEDASGFNDALYGTLFADGTVVYDQDKDGTLENGDDYSAPDTNSDGVPNASEGAYGAPGAELQSITGQVIAVDLAAHSMSVRVDNAVIWLVYVDPFTAITPFEMPAEPPLDGDPGVQPGGAGGEPTGSFLGGVPFDSNLVGKTVMVEGVGSLELGIDIGHVDLVCHIGAPRSLSTLLQRVGRSGHWLGGVSRGILFPQTRDELMQCAAAVRAVRTGELDRVNIPQKPLDILAQQIVATLASGELLEEEMWRLCRRAYPYSHLSRKEFEGILQMLSEGISTRRGRSTAMIHRDRVQGRLRARRGARLAAITSGGAIPDVADYDVIQEPSGTFVGKVNEDFAVESMAGDVFLLGNQSWRIRRIGSGKIRVEDAHGTAPNIPFWLGEAPARTPELSEAVSTVREKIAELLNAAPTPVDNAASLAGKDDCHWLFENCGLEQSGAEQLLSYVRETIGVLGLVPTQRTIVAERFFDESGGMQLVLHAPFGGRINRAWGLALRKRFCLTFDFELQAAATDDGLVLSLGEQHSFPLASVASMARSHAVRADLIQALLASPMFGNRWRWNATRALALLRFHGGKRVPMPIQRMRAEDLLAAVFPAQVACQDNHAGPIELPDHPLVNQTIEDCLHEPMDVDGFTDFLQTIEEGKIAIISRDTPAPSPMSHEILNANPYAFLDDAPLEERRARAVSLKRIDTELSELGGKLDLHAVEDVRSQLWPEVRDPDELHDTLLSLVLLPVSEAGAWAEFARQLIEQGRASLASWKTPDEKAHQAYVSVERVTWVQCLLEQVIWEPVVHPLDWSRHGTEPTNSEETMALLVQGWMDVLGPTTPALLARRLGMETSRIQAALLRLEAQGQVLRGQFTSTTDQEWCERRILARIHRRTLGKLRREIEPVSAADYIRFLLNWQHVEPGTQLHGKQGILEIIHQLQGLELPASAWEQEILPRRIEHYEPADLESLCLSGLVGWGRLRTQGEPPTQYEETPTEEDRPMSARRRQKPTRSAPLAFFLREDLPKFLDMSPLAIPPPSGLSANARDVLSFLERFGASFLQEITRGAGRLAAEVEDALWELVCRGLVTGDGVAGLRILLLPPQKRRLPEQRLKVVKGTASPGRMMPVGRWALLRQPMATVDFSQQTESSARLKVHLPWSTSGSLAEATRGLGSPSEVSPAAEAMARQYLRRYGIVIREVLARETLYPGWRSLLKIYWRMEARGEIRGGRFVDGFPGEQFALPLAIDALRSLRRESLRTSAVTLVSSTDPLNLIGILTPGSRISPFADFTIAYQQGVPVEIGELGEVLSRLQGRMPRQL